MGFTIASWFDFFKTYLNEAFSLGSVQEQVRWVYFGFVRVRGFLKHAENEMRLFINSLQPANARLSSLAPADLQQAKDLREKMTALSELREHRDHFDWMRPEGPAKPLDAHVLPLLSKHLHLLEPGDQVAAKAIGPLSKPSAADTSEPGHVPKKPKPSPTGVPKKGLVGTGGAQLPGSQAHSALYLVVRFVHARAPDRPPIP